MLLSRFSYHRSVGRIPLPGSGIVGKNRSARSKTTVRSKGAYTLKVWRGYLHCAPHLHIWLMFRVPNVYSGGRQIIKNQKKTNSYSDWRWDERIGILSNCQHGIQAQNRPREINFTIRWNSRVSINKKKISKVKQGPGSLRPKIWYLCLQLAVYIEKLC